MKILAVIPARGGSKGVPGKNKMILAGRPILQYTIDFLEKSIYKPTTVVTTEDIRIETIARSLGVPCIPRAAHLQGDDGFCVDATRDVFLEYERYGNNFDLVVQLYASSPIRPEGCLDKAIQMMNDNPDISGLYTVFRAEPVNLVGMEGNFLTFPYGRPAYSRQKMPPVYEMATAFYIFRPEWLRVPRHKNEYYSYFGPNIGGMEIDREHAIDINIPEDVVKAEQYISAHHNHKEAEQQNLLSTFGFIHE